MILTRARPVYDAVDEEKARQALRKADAENVKKGRDIYVGQGLGRLIYVDAAGGKYEIKAEAGVLTATLVP